MPGKRKSTETEVAVTTKKQKKEVEVPKAISLKPPAAPTTVPHPLSSRLKSIGKCGKIMSLDGTRTPKGLTKLLEANFYPNYSYTAATLGPSGTVKLAANDVKVRGGKKTGIWTDDKIEQSIDIMRKYSFPAQVFWDRTEYMRALKRQGVLKTDREKLKVIYRAQTSKGKAKYKPYVKLFWEAMHELDLRPTSTQVAVRHASLPVFTCADAVAMDAKGKYHVIEVKTGYEKNWHKHTQFKMKYPFSECNDSAFNQHQLQVTATNEMYKHTFPSHKMGDPVLLNFNSAGYKVVPLQPWAANPTTVATMFQLIRIPSSGSTSLKLKKTNNSSSVRKTVSKTRVNSTSKGGSRRTPRKR